jgi:DNA-binding protein HU-beta
MNTSEFAKALAARTDMTVADATNVTKHFLDLLKEGVNKGERIAFLGFGTFTVSRRAARTGVNPQNPGQKVKIPARNVVRFTPGASLKAAANGKFKPLATAKKAETKAVATAKKDVKKVTTAAKRTTAKATTAAKATARKAVPKKPAAKKPAAKKPAPKRK